jgi:hypothetical protein
MALHHISGEMSDELSDCLAGTRYYTIHFDDITTLQPAE